MAAKKNSHNRKTNPSRTTRPVNFLSALKAEDKALREPEIPVDDEQMISTLSKAVPIPKDLRGSAPDSALEAAERDALAAEFEKEVRKEFPRDRSPEFVAFRRFWSLWKAAYLKAGHKRLARFALHYFE